MLVGVLPTQRLAERSGRILGRRLICAFAREVHATGMNPELRTQGTSEAARDAAYRRLVAVALRLDVATLAQELRAARLESQQTAELPKAA
jgi:hypothetical protein